jgi:phosphate transport system substrate-binding protein
MFRQVLIAAAAIVAIAGCGQPVVKRVEGDGAANAGPAAIRVVGSSTVYPFTSAVAEQFGATGAFPKPIVESTGTGGGIKQFCSGTGLDTPSIANASRPMKLSEFEECSKNGVADIVEFKVGFDGVVIANAKDGATFALTLEDVYKALAKDVPAATGFAQNTTQTWADVNPRLPNVKISVLGPPTTSGTRDSWNELGMEGGAAKLPVLAALKKSNEAEFKRVGASIREDGAWTNMGESDNAIVQQLITNKDQLGVFGYSFLEENMDRLKAATVGGVAPTAESISSGAYPISRSLFIYVKKSHLETVTGLREFVVEYTSDKATGSDGYLTGKGLVPLPKAEHDANKAAAGTMTSMAAPAK